MAGVKGRSGRWRKLDETMLADVRKLSLREGLRFLKDKSIPPAKKAPYIFSVIGKLIPDKQEIRSVRMEISQDLIERMIQLLDTGKNYDNLSIIDAKEVEGTATDSVIIPPKSNHSNDLHE